MARPFQPTWSSLRALSAATFSVMLFACGARTGPLSETNETSTSSGAGGSTATSSTSSSGSGTGGRGGAVACDEDGDGHPALFCGGDDCQDDDPAIYPGARDSNVGVGPWLKTRVMENIPGDSRGQPAIFVEPSGFVHLAHSSVGLRYASDRSGTWSAEVVDPAAKGNPSLAVDSAGTVHMSYFADGALHHAMGSAGAWNIETIDDTATGESSLALGALERPVMLYPAADGIRYAERKPDGWHVVLIFAGDTAAPSLHIAGGLSASFAAANTGAGDGVWVGRYNEAEAAWGFELIAAGSPVASTSIARDVSGALYVAYSLLQRPLGPHVASSVGGGWSTEPVGDGQVAWSVSVATSPAFPGRVNLAYDDLVIRYAVREGGTWQVSSTATTGYTPSLALDADGAAHLTYSDFSFSVETFVDYLTDRAVIPDGIDQNCDGVDGLDEDQDGYASRTTGGEDCNDDAPLVYSGAPDALGDGIDQDCGGNDGPG